MDIPITFLDFKTEKNYLALQNKYARFGEHNNSNEDDYLNVITDDFTIIFKCISPVTGLEDYIKLSFNNNFLFPKINRLAYEYIKWFKNYLEGNLDIKEEKIKSFARLQLKKIIDLEVTISGSKYLNKKIRVILCNQIEIIIEYLSNVHILPNYLVEDKLKFNLNKTDVLVLFTLLRDKGIINSPYDAELGLFIEKNLLYKNSGDYSPIKNAGKVVNDVKNFNKPVEKSIQRLKDIFQNDDFYELEVH